jgi:hypothetical protein
MLQRRILAVVLVLLVALAVLVALRRTRSGPAAPARTGVGYRFGAVSVDTVERTIVLPARVRRDSGTVLTLLHLDGYPWLRDSAALTSPARLSDLQRSLSLLDWALWDSLWRGLRPGRSPALLLDDRPARAYLAPTSPEPDLAALIFLGSPEFDPVVLGGADAGECLTCPAFERERAVILAALRPDAEVPGLNLKPRTLPPPGAAVIVEIALPVR